MIHVGYRASDTELGQKRRALRWGDKRKERRRKGGREEGKEGIQKCVRKPENSIRNRKKQFLLKEKNFFF